jgi:hypothetical protein
VTVFTEERRWRRAGDSNPRYACISKPRKCRRSLGPFFHQRRIKVDAPLRRQFETAPASRQRSLSALAGVLDGRQSADNKRGFRRGRFYPMARSLFSSRLTREQESRKAGRRLQRQPPSSARPSSDSECRLICRLFSVLLPSIRVYGLCMNSLRSWTRFPSGRPRTDLKPMPQRLDRV